MGGLVLGGHEVDDVALGADEEDLEDDVVDGLGGEQVQVTGDIDQQVQGLGLERDAGATLQFGEAITLASPRSCLVG
jgi:hypothetical protein